MIPCSFHLFVATFALALRRKLAKGPLRALIRQAGLTVEEFQNLLWTERGDCLWAQWAVA